jgi:hypothetical protein
MGVRRASGRAGWVPRLATGLLVVMLLSGAGMFTRLSARTAAGVAAGPSPHAVVTEGAPAVLTASSTAPPKSVRRISGWLHTDGRMILDARGRRVRFVSMGIHGMEVGAGLPDGSSRGAFGTKGWQVPSAGTYANVAAWGFNSVRLAWSWANLEPSPPTSTKNGRVVHHYNLAYVRALRSIVRAFAARRVAVILDMHQNEWSPAFARGGTRFEGCGLPAWLYRGSGNGSEDGARAAFFADRGGVQQRLAGAWRFLAARFAHDRMVVGADLFNEPYALKDGALRPSKLHLDALYARLGAAVRRGDPRILLIFEDSQDLGTGAFGLTRPPAFANEVYSFHTYRDTWRLARASIRRYAARAARWSVPLWIGEFNGFNAATNARAPSPRWARDLRAMMSYTRRAGIGWSFWAYDGANSLVYLHSNTPKQPLLRILRSGR